MSKSILVTGASDGIGLEAAKLLVSQGHQVLIHGRNREKLDSVQQLLSALPNGGPVESYVADLSRLSDVDTFADAVMSKHKKLDVLINNAGILKSPKVITEDNLDVRFMVNTIAPFRLTQRLLPIIGPSGCILNLSSAAQAPVDLGALAEARPMSDMDAYSQSKLAITAWSRTLAAEEGAPTVIAVNPGSLLGTKMVKEGFGTDGKDIGIGANILVRLALEDDIKQASGQYFDNDSGDFGPPHPDVLDHAKAIAIVSAVEAVIERLS